MPSPLLAPVQPVQEHQTPEALPWGWALGIGVRPGHAINLDHSPVPDSPPLQGHVVLTDFGLCKECVEPEETTCTFCGTPEVS